MPIQNKNIRLQSGGNEAKIEAFYIPNADKNNLPVHLAALKHGDSFYL